jgi:ribonuclease BN (tRNA processing enzyme)
VIFNTAFAGQLRDHGFTHIFVEHLYEDHIKGLSTLPFVSFLQECERNGLNLTALDDETLYKTCKKEWRVPLLNKKIIDAVDAEIKTLREERNDCPASTKTVLLGC